MLSQEYDMVVYVEDEGVIALACDIADGAEVYYFLDGVEYQRDLETDEYRVLGYFNDAP